MFILAAIHAAAMLPIDLSLPSLVSVNYFVINHGKGCKPSVKGSAV